MENITDESSSEIIDTVLRIDRDELERPHQHQRLMASGIGKKDLIRMKQEAGDKKDKEG